MSRLAARLAQGAEMTFSVEKLAIEGLVIVHSRRFLDQRGYFMETWSREQFELLVIPSVFIQENQSLSRQVNTLRGLHFQKAPFEQAKLVRVLAGRVFDVSVDLRRNSPTFGKWCGVELAGGDGRQLYIPRGFAHGFLSLEPDTLVTYKVDAPYAPEHEGGIRWDDAEIDIEWPIGQGQPILSDRDRERPSLRECSPS